MFPSLIKKAYADSIPAQTTHFVQNILNEIVNPVITLMVGVAVVVFLYGVFEFVRNAESSDERKKGGEHMLWGAIGLFIMVTAYGILNLIIGTINTH